MYLKLRGNLKLHGVNTAWMKVQFRKIAFSFLVHVITYWRASEQSKRGTGRAGERVSKASEALAGLASE